MHPISKVHTTRNFLLQMEEVIENIAQEEINKVRNKLQEKYKYLRVIYYKNNKQNHGKNQI